MNKDDFKLKLTELYSALLDLKMQEGVSCYTPLYAYLNAADYSLSQAISNIDQYEHEDDCL